MSGARYFLVVKGQLYIYEGYRLARPAFAILRDDLPGCCCGSTLLHNLKMETLIVILIVFIPMGWLMWRMLRFTRNSIGSRSPLKVSRVYKTTACSFFVSFESFNALHAFLFGGFIAYCVIFVPFATPNPELGRLLMSLLGLLVTGLGIMTAAVDLNHWKFAKHITIETFPKEHELEVHFKDVTLRLKDGDIARIEVSSK